MSSTKSGAKPEWAAFAAEVKRLRAERGLQKQQLASLVGAAPSWISGVESGTIAPSQRRVEALALALGVPLTSLPVPAERNFERADAAEGGDPDVLLPLIWRARCDLLRGLAQSTPAKQPERRRRLQQLASYVDRTAAEHPSAAAFSANKSLWPLHALAEHAPAWARAVALAEVACMKIDAPFETGAHRDKERLTHLDFIAVDLGLGAEVGENVAKSVLEARTKLPLPLWQELMPIGGSRGLLALRSLVPDSEGLEVLVGADPAGWLGSPYAGGRWLLEGADEAAGPSGSPITGIDQTWGPASLVGAASGTAIMMGAILGPIVGAAAAGVLTAAAASRAAQRAAQRAEVSAQQVSVELAKRRAHQADADSQAQRIAVIAESFGRHWVNVECCKLLALYEAMRDIGDSNEPSLASPSSAAHRCALVSGAVKRALSEEVAASGTKNPTANERIKELGQISEALMSTATTLRSRHCAPPQAPVAPAGP